jgi:hypothetical protein
MEYMINLRNLQKKGQEKNKIILVTLKLPKNPHNNLIEFKRDFKFLRGDKFEINFNRCRYIWKRRFL